LEYLQKEPLPDIILTDCEMPNLNGREATRQLRSWANDPEASAIQKQAANIPVIALTAAALADERVKCIECGMTDYLSKPLKIAMLKEMLGRIFADKI
jgi:CheY-like chemotaxis protein